MKALKLFGCCLFVAASSFADTVSLPVVGTSDPWLAGMPNGSTASLVDSAPGQSPVLVPVSLFAGTTITFAVSGGTMNFGGCNPITMSGCNGPDGGGLISHLTGAENGISDVTAPINALIGVFLGSGQPNLSGAPSGLDFGAIGTNFASLSPALKQVFFIGDGKAGAVVQSFVVPAGATRLYLGTMDGFEWNNNSGALQVQVTTPSAIPEPSSYLLFTTVVAGAFLMRRFTSSSK